MPVPSSHHDEAQLRSRSKQRRGRAQRHVDSLPWIEARHQADHRRIRRDVVARIHFGLQVGALLTVRCSYVDAIWRQRERTGAPGVRALLPGGERAVDQDVIASQQCRRGVHPRAERTVLIKHPGHARLPRDGSPDQMCVGHARVHEREAAVRHVSGNLPRWRFARTTGG